MVLAGGYLWQEYLLFASVTILSSFGVARTVTYVIKSARKPTLTVYLLNVVLLFSIVVLLYSTGETLYNSPDSLLQSTSIC